MGEQPLDAPPQVVVVLDQEEFLDALVDDRLQVLQAPFEFLPGGRLAQEADRSQGIGLPRGILAGDDVDRDVAQPGIGIEGLATASRSCREAAGRE
jgi:hypothetical protein